MWGIDRKSVVDFRRYYARFTQHVEMLSLSVLLDADGGLIYAMLPSPHGRWWMSVAVVGKPDGSV
jgi:hypothetical protein